MRIESCYGDILDDSARVIVNPVNCVGVMGKGLALSVKQRYPKSFLEYKKACNEKRVAPGFMFLTEEKNRLIIHFPTKRHWKDSSHYYDISYGLEDLVRIVVDRNIQEIAIPPLGCGLGGLDWKIVRPMICEAFSKQNNHATVRLYEPVSTKDFYACVRES